MPNPAINGSEERLDVIIEELRLLRESFEDRFLVLANMLREPPRPNELGPIKAKRK